jgi:hypothetical protein
VTYACYERTFLAVMFNNSTNQDILEIVLMNLVFLYIEMYVSLMSMFILSFIGGIVRGLFEWKRICAGFMYRLFMVLPWRSIIKRALLRYQSHMSWSFLCSKNITNQNAKPKWFWNILQLNRVPFFKDDKHVFSLPFFFVGFVLVKY